MYPRFAFALLFSVCAFGLGIAIPAFPVEKCGVNAEYRQCGSACVPDCSHPEPYEICTLQCVSGCFCKEGYLKNSKGECVRREDCDAQTHHDIPMAVPMALNAAPQCPENEEFRACGSACPATCAKPNAPNQPCTRQCVIGCFCKAGLMRNSRGVCVRAEQCDAPQMAAEIAIPKCPENEEFHSCGTACPATCANPNAPNQPCTKQCVIGCFCKAGHMRNAHSVCVRAEQCEAPQVNMFFAYPPEVSQCKENEVFMPCGSACAPTCANPHPGPVCTLQCVIGCFCKPGYLKNEQGVCVPSEQCGVPAAEAFPMPPQGICSENEEYRQCKGCDGTCAKPNPICPRICIPGCACKQGHLRDGNGRCMPASQCPHVQLAEAMMLPPNKCGENEIFHTCGTACPATCSNPHPSPVCTKNCVIGCFCKEGFLKNAQGKCVAAANCEAPVAHIMEAVAEHKCDSDRETYINDPVAAQLDCLASCGTPLPYLIHGEPQVAKKCQEAPRKAACVCKKPYVRNSQGRCVERSECEKTN